MLLLRSNTQSATTNKANIYSIRSLDVLDTGDAFWVYLYYYQATFFSPAKKMLHYFVNK